MKRASYFDSICGMCTLTFASSFLTSFPPPSLLVPVADVTVAWQPNDAAADQPVTGRRAAAAAAAAAATAPSTSVGGSIAAERDPTHHMRTKPQRVAECYISAGRACTSPCSSTCQELEYDEGDGVVAHVRRTLTPTPSACLMERERERERERESTVVSLVCTRVTSTRRCIPDQTPSRPNVP